MKDDKLAVRWYGELPDDVRAIMLDVLSEALREAARKESPSDGNMIPLSPARTIGEGKWGGGWDLQSSFVRDTRMHDVPFIIVHAYQGSTLARGSVALARGSVAADVSRTPTDQEYIDRVRLAAMTSQRDALNAAIAELTAKLAPKPFEEPTGDPRDLSRRFRED